MLDDVVIEMMSSEFILWRCLHGGPLTKQTIDQPEPHPHTPWDRLRARNLPLLDRLTKVLHRPLVLASEEDLAEAFYDCEPGAVPAVGEDYLIPTIVDERLRHLEEVFFEAGDHERLVHISSDGFSRLMQDAEYLAITVPHG